MGLGGHMFGCGGFGFCVLFLDFYLPLHYFFKEHNKMLELYPNLSAQEDGLLFYFISFLNECTRTRLMPWFCWHMYCILYYLSYYLYHWSNYWPASRFRATSRHENMAMGGRQWSYIPVLRPCRGYGAQSRQGRDRLGRVPVLLNTVKYGWRTMTI